MDADAFTTAAGWSAIAGVDLPTRLTLEKFQRTGSGSRGDRRIARLPPPSTRRA
jgi:hypothetical protein